MFQGRQIFQFVCILIFKDIENVTRWFVKVFAKVDCGNFRKMVEYIAALSLRM